MARLTKLVLMVVSIVGSSAVTPTTTSAGVIPWVYNAIFGPVGSMPRRGYYGPTYASYGSYYAPMAVAYAPASSYYSGGSGCSSCQSNYAPSSYYTSYAPYTTAYAPSYGYDAFYGSFPQTSYYGSNCCNSCSGCSTCGTGCSSCGYGQPCSSCNAGCSTCSGGSGCSNCTVNSAPSNMGPTPAGYGSGTYGSSNYNSNVGAPIPDPYNSRDVNSRLNELERRQNELQHRQSEDERFLRNQHKDTYNPERYNGQSDPYSRPSTYREREENVPARRRGTTTLDSNTANPDTYEPPIRGRNPAPAIDPLEEDRRKPVLAAPTPIDDNSSGKGKEGAVNFKEDEPQTRRLEDRSTTQAVAPRQRMQIVTKQSKALIAKSSKPVKTSSAASGTAELAKN